jgi:hypothetical protein
MNDKAKAYYNQCITANGGAYQQAQAEFMQADAAGDEDGAASALQTMAALRATRQQMDAMYSEATTQAYRLPGEENMSKRDVDLCRHYRLSPDDLATAKSWTGDPRVSDIERVETYLRNAGKLRQMRANGTYRDDQGGRR